jgi:hypothetical protein
VRRAVAVAVAWAAAIAPASAADAQERSAVVATPRWRIGIGALAAHAVGTMGDYLAGACGVVATARFEAGPRLSARADAELVRFLPRTVRRRYEGSGPPIDIATGSSLVLVTAGPELRARAGRASAGVRVGVGAAAFSNRGSTSGLDSSVQTVRAATFSTLTWAAQAGLALALRLAAPPSAVRLEASIRLVAAGRTAFLREYNLPVGIISGLYPQPTPYAPRLGIVSLGVLVPS